MLIRTKEIMVAPIKLSKNIGIIKENMIMVVPENMMIIRIEGKMIGEIEDMAIVISGSREIETIDTATIMLIGLRGSSLTPTQISGSFTSMILTFMLQLYARRSLHTNLKYRYSSRIKMRVRMLTMGLQGP